MFTIKEIDAHAIHLWHLSSVDGATQALIDPSLGGRLVALTYKGQDIITFVSAEDYAMSYASAVLFPFANRIEGGRYSFRRKAYQLVCNEPEGVNAIHGLVHDQNFSHQSSKSTAETASLSLVHRYDGGVKGYPFPYEIRLTYVLEEGGIQLGVEVTNLGSTAMPYSLGWHPYFHIDKEDKALIAFDADRHYITDDRQIIMGEEPLSSPIQMNLSEYALDDGYRLKTNRIYLDTDRYQMTIDTGQESGYVQVFTPQDGRSVAIEPMTGATDCFNNQIGLRTLVSGDRFTATWRLSFCLNR